MSLPVSDVTLVTRRSACTVVSISAVIHRLLKIDDIGDITTILMGAIQEGVSVATTLASTETKIEHLAVDEVWPLVPSFFESGIIRETESIHAVLSVTEECFMELLRKALSLPASVVGIVLTKPPMTVSIVVDCRSGRPKYRIFDSHARPECGLDSAYFVTGDGLLECALNLQLLFPRISDQQEDLALELTYHSFEANLFYKA